MKAEGDKGEEEESAKSIYTVSTDHFAVQERF